MLLCVCVCVCVRVCYVHEGECVGGVYMCVVCRHRKRTVSNKHVIQLSIRMECKHKRHYNTSNSQMA